MVMVDMVFSDIEKMMDFISNDDILFRYWRDGKYAANIYLCEYSTDFHLYGIDDCGKEWEYWFRIFDIQSDGSCVHVDKNAIRENFPPAKIESIVDINTIAKSDGLERRIMEMEAALAKQNLKIKWLMERSNGNQRYED